MCLSVSGVLEAQHVAVAANASGPSVNAAGVLARAVTIRFTRVSAQEAVEAIAANAGVRVVYPQRVLDAVRGPVTLHAANLALGAAFERIFAGSRLQVVVLGADLVGIEVAPEAKEVVQGTIVGTVRNAKTKQPVAGATILLDDAKTGVVTGEDGMFRVPANVGDHIVRVRGIGFIRHAQSVSVSEGQVVTISIVLDVSASVLDEVVVTGTIIATERKAIPTPITVIKAEEIERRGITRIEQLFRGEVPGVFAANKGIRTYYGGQPGDSVGMSNMVSSGVYARGTSNIYDSPTPLKTYIDGVEMLDPSYLGTIDPQSIERIEIITGPQAATIYGSGAMGGVMQIFTKRGDGAQHVDLTLRLRYGMLETNMSAGLTPEHNHSVNLTGGTGPAFSYTGTLSYNYTGQWQPRLFNRVLGASVGVTHVQGPVTVSGTVTTSNTRNGVTSGIGNTDSPYGRYLVAAGIWEESGNRRSMPSQRVATSSNQTLALSATYRQSAHWQHSATVGRNQSVFATIPNAPMFTTPADSMYGAANSSGQRTTLSYNTTLIPPTLGALAMTLTLGANGSSAKRTSANGCLASKSGSTLVMCRPTLPVGASQPVNSESWGGFGSLRVGVFEQVYVTLGVRGERHPNYGGNHKTDWTPTHGVTYTIEFGDLTLKALGSYGRATRPPSDDQRREVLALEPGFNPAQWVSQMANPDLKPEYSRGPQGGVEIYWGNRGSVTVNRYRQVVSDLIQNVNVDSQYVEEVGTTWSGYAPVAKNLNVGEVLSHGWETTASVNVWRVNIRGTYSWNDSRIRQVSPKLSSCAGCYQRGQMMNNIPTHTGNLSANYAFGATTVSLVTNWIGRTQMPAGEHEVRWHMLTYRLKMYYDVMRNQAVGNWFQYSKPAYAKSDFFATHRLTSAISTTLNIVNLGNSIVSDNAMHYPSLGRQTSLGLSIKWP